MKISFLQTTGPKAWSGMTTKNHLGAIWQAEPQVASTLITKMLAEAYGYTLETLLSQVEPLYLDTDDDYTWQLIGNSERNIPLVEAHDASGTLIDAATIGVGANGEEFTLTFAERWFSDVQVIVGEKNEIYPIRILEDGTPDGTNFKYRCEMWGNAKVDGMPGEELTGGKLFSWDYSPVEDTLSIKGSEPTYVAPITFRNTFSQMRMEYTAPGNMIDRKFGAKFEQVGPGGEKQSFQTWLEYNNWVFEYQFMQAKNRLLYYGRSARDASGRFLSVGKSGHVIRAGAGLREQMETSNTIFYNVFTTDLITNILTELAEGKLPMDQRSFVIRTGERGAILFHRAVSDTASGWTPLFDTSAIKSASSNLHSDSRSFGFQFVEYLAPNNVRVRIEVDPLYTDPVRNKIPAPNNGNFVGGLAESYRMDIFDIGTVEGEPNIRKVYAKNNPDITGYIPGLRDPFSPTGGRPKMMASPKDGYYVTKYATCSAMIKDPSRTASLIPSVLAV